MKFYLESLGCPKNLVDAHGMTRLLVHLGHRPVEDLRPAQVLIVNTCGFVEDARAESLGELRKLARKKRPGQVLIAAGCLSQLWGDRLLDAGKTG
ncbi:MAG: 30S ribosomal protein S12 methylthiotransferase RimO, partial [Chloroflexi bacterium]